MEEDRISQLPDEILCSIISCLNAKYAMRTGVLAKRWRGLWKHTTSIDIDGPAMFQPNIHPIVQCYYFDTQYLRLHEASKIKSLRIRLQLDMQSAVPPVALLSLPIKDNIERLHIDFTGGCPASVSIGGSNLKQLELKSCLLDRLPDVPALQFYTYPLPDVPGFRFLSILDLVKVFVEENRLTSILDGCVSLQRVNILCCIGFKNLKISSQYLELTTFHIEGCHQLQSFSFEALGLFITRNGQYPCIYVDYLKHNNHLVLNYCALLPESTFCGLKSLCKLLLVSVVVTSSVIDKLLSVCKNLKDFRLNGCTGVARLRIKCSPSTHMDVIEIIAMRNLGQVELCDAEVGLFYYSGQRIALSFNGTCSVNLVTLRTNDANFIWQSISSLPRSITNFTTLVLDVPGNIKGKLMPQTSKTFGNIQALDVSVDKLTYNNLAWIVKLLNSLRVVQKFCLQKNMMEGQGPGQITSFPSSSHLCLHRVDLHGFSGSKSEIELIRFLLHDSPRLSTLTLQLHPCLGGERRLKVFELLNKHICSQNANLRIARMPNDLMLSDS